VSYLTKIMGYFGQIQLFRSRLPLSRSGTNYVSHCIVSFIWAELRHQAINSSSKIANLKKLRQ